MENTGTSNKSLVVVLRMSPERLRTAMTVPAPENNSTTSLSDLTRHNEASTSLTTGPSALEKGKGKAKHLIVTLKLNSETLRQFSEESLADTSVASVSKSKKVKAEGSTKAKVVMTHAGPSKRRGRPPKEEESRYMRRKRLRLEAEQGGSDIGNSGTTNEATEASNPGITHKRQTKRKHAEGPGMEASGNTVDLTEESPRKRQHTDIAPELQQSILEPTEPNVASEAPTNDELIFQDEFEGKVWDYSCFRGQFYLVCQVRNYFGPNGEHVGPSDYGHFPFVRKFGVEVLDPLGPTHHAKVILTAQFLNSNSTTDPSNGAIDPNAGPDDNSNDQRMDDIPIDPRLFFINFRGAFSQFQSMVSFLSYLTVLQLQ